MKHSLSFLDEINNSVLLGDGAIGTELFGRTEGAELCAEKINITNPDLVLQIHKEYVDAGSRVIETNTFGANRPNFSRHGIEDHLNKIIKKGVRLAKKSAGKNIYVAASIGPLPSIEGEPIIKSEQTLHFTEIIKTFLDEEVDLIIFESFSDIDELENAVTIARSLSAIPIIAQAAFDQNGYTASSFSAKETAKRCKSAGANMVGANCGYGIPSIISAIKQMSELDIPLSAFINAGFPEQVEGRLLYRSAPDYIVHRAQDLLDYGVRLIGGCCGVGPETIRAMSTKIAEFNKTIVSPGIKIQGVYDESVSPVKSKSSPHLNWKVLVELDPPLAPEMSGLLDFAVELSKTNIDAITVADNPLASVRVDTITSASLIHQKSGLPVIPHMTGRDRNRIALQSTIMGAYVSGIRSVICITGDPVRMCQQPNTSGVFDVNSIGLVKLVSDFNKTNNLSDSISIGVALNPNVKNMSGQISKLNRKIESGADFILTQPIFTEERLELLLESVSEDSFDKRIFIGILPLTSSKNAEFIHNEVPGIYIPEQIRNELSKYDKIEDQRKAGADLCIEFIQKISSQVKGFYIIAPRTKPEIILPVIKSIA